MKLQSHTHSYHTHALKQPTNKRKPLTIISCITPQQDLQGKSVAVIGLGKSGRAAARLALARGASSVVAIDKNLNLALLEQDPVFEKNGTLGDFDGKLLWDVDTVVVYPRVPLENYGLFSLVQSMLSHLGIEAFVGGKPWKSTLRSCFTTLRVAITKTQISGCCGGS